jgi:hypothetical protein
MTTYARIDPSDGAVTLVQMSAAEFASMQAHPTRAAQFRSYVIDQQPTATATQVVVDAGFVVEPSQVRRTWALREKTTDELEADALAADLLQIGALLDSINAQNEISNSAFTGMTTVQKFDVLRVDRNNVLKAVKFLLRRARQGK